MAGIEQVFDIARIELHPAAIDDVFDAASDADVTVRIHCRKIT